MSANSRWDLIRGLKGLKKKERKKESSIFSKTELEESPTSSLQLMSRVQGYYCIGIEHYLMNELSCVSCALG